MNEPTSLCSTRDSDAGCTTKYHTQPWITAILCVQLQRAAILHNKVWLRRDIETWGKQVGISNNRASHFSMMVSTWPPTCRTCKRPITAKQGAQVHLNDALNTSLLDEGRHIYFTDGCSYKTISEDIVSYAIVELNNNSYITVKALELLEGETGNIITDSAYDLVAVHVNGPMWVKRNFKTLAETTVSYCEVLKMLVKAMDLHIEVPVINAKATGKKARSHKETMQ